MEIRTHCPEGHKALNDSGYCPTCRTRNDGSKVENHGKRGPDTKPRPPRDKKSFQARYYDATGRTVNMDMRRMQERIASMQQLADNMGNENPKQKFDMLKEVQQMEDKFYKTFGPYMLQKQGTMKTETVEEDMVSLDDVLNGNDDADNRSY